MKWHIEMSFISSSYVFTNKFNYWQISSQGSRLSHINLRKHVAINAATSHLGCVRIGDLSLFSYYLMLLQFSLSMAIFVTAHLSAMAAPPGFWATGACEAFGALGGARPTRPSTTQSSARWMPPRFGRFATIRWRRCGEHSRTSCWEHGWWQRGLGALVRFAWACPACPACPAQLSCIFMTRLARSLESSGPFSLHNPNLDHGNTKQDECDGDVHGDGGDT